MLRRGLPASVFVHMLGIFLVVMFGNQVARHPVKPPRSIAVKMVQLPQTKPPVTKTVEEAVQPADQPEVEPDLPPKELPKPKPDPEPVKKEEQPEVKSPDPEPETPVTETKTEVAPTPVGLTTPSITGTDENFPFAWYVSLIEGKVVNNWEPKKLGFGKRAIVSCTVHFRIGRNGAVSQVTLVRNSGVGVYDREALRAVKTTRLPPLPPQYTGSSLGITFTFNLEPGS